MSKTKISIVAGGAGFIGSHLCDALLAAGHEVYAVDNLATGNRQNNAAAVKNSAFHFLEHDVTQPVPLTVRPDYIFHLASPASVPDYQRLMEETALVNALGTRLLLQFAHASGARFLFASTSEVYGDPKEHPQRETYWGNVNPNGERACYDESKRYGEMMTELYVRKHNVDARIVRIFNTYGPRMRKTDGRVVSNFINQALRNEPFTIYGDGTQTRSFCFVSDLVNGLLKLMFTENIQGEVVNLGNPEEFQMLDFAKKIAGITGQTPKFVFKPLPVDDPTQRKPDIQKAKSLLEWVPTVSIDAGLRQTVEYYKSATY